MLTDNQFIDEQRRDKLSAALDRRVLALSDIAQTMAQNHGFSQTMG